MEGLRKISVLLVLVAILHQARSYMDSRTALHIPEKILGSVIDIVQSHKNKPTQTNTQQYPGNQPYPQYQQWNQPGNFQGQGQFQGLGQYQNQGQAQAQAQGQYQGQGQAQNQFQQQGHGQYYPQNNNVYPQNNAPVATYPQPTYPGNGVQYPSQNVIPNQPQQYYPPSSGQLQGQVQQGSGQYQGQAQQQTGFQTAQNQYPSQSTQVQGQNQQTGFQTGQNQYPSQSTHIQGQNQSTGQYTGQELSTSQFQAVQGSGSQSSGFQVSGGHTGNQGPSCVCQAWTKPKGEVGPATLDKTEPTEV